jgi:PAS domain S-box-containing protein
MAVPPTDPKSESSFAGSEPTPPRASSPESGDAKTAADAAGAGALAADVASEHLANDPTSQAQRGRRRRYSRVRAPRYTRTDLPELVHRREVEGLLGQLEMERARLQAVLQQLPVGVVLAEAPSGTALVVNDQAKRITADDFAPRVPVQQYQETQTFQGLYPDGRVYQAEDWPLARALSRGEVVEREEIELVRSDGSHVTIEASARPIYDRDGNIVAGATVFTDITARKALEAELRAAKHDVEQQYERLVGLVESVDISLAIMDREGRILVVNRAWEERTGVHRECSLGKRYEEFDTPKIDKAAILSYQAIIDRLLATGETQVFREIRVDNGPNPEEVYVDASMVPMRNAEGEVTGLLSVSIDVTKKVRSRLEIEAQRALLDAIIQGTPVGLSLFDQELHRVDANSTWVAMMGLNGPPSALKGRHFYDLVPSARDRQATQRRVLAGDSIYHSDVEFRHPVSGRALYCDVYYTPLREAGGKIGGLLSALVDVTNRHEADRQKDDFLALAAHELKSPITTIKGLSQMLVRRSLRADAAQGLDDRTIRALNVIDEQTRRLTALIDEMLDVSRIGGEQLALYIAPIDLVDLVKEVVANIELAAPDFLFSVETPVTATQVVVSADRQRIEQVLSNLLQNAVKYSGNERRVDVSLTLNGVRRGLAPAGGYPGQGEAVVAVRDYGIGIPAGEVQRVFERFFRASNTEQRAGLGLGLFISHGIIEAHGGKMWCETAEGQGSAFYFSLPLAPA